MRPVVVSALGPLVAAALLVQTSPAPADVPDGYVTLRIQGFTVHVERELARAYDALGRDALELLEARLLDVRRAVPERALARLAEVPIWLDRNDPRFPCAVYHPSVEWLRENGVDPRKAKSVHLSNARNFLDWSREQPWMVLHELAHAYHDRLDAADRERVAAAHARAARSGAYERVLRASGAEEPHYALTNPDEFFAEASEAWFGTNDFYPFVRAELARHDAETAALVADLWGR